MCAAFVDILFNKQINSLNFIEKYCQINSAQHARYICFTSIGLYHQIQIHYLSSETFDFIKLHSMPLNEYQQSFHQKKTEKNEH